MNADATDGTLLKVAYPLTTSSSDDRLLQNTITIQFNVQYSNLLTFILRSRGIPGHE